MTLNGVITLISRYFTEFDNFGADYVTVVEDRPTCIIAAKYRLPVRLIVFGQNCPTQQSHGLFATAKLCVSFTDDCDIHL